MNRSLISSLALHGTLLLALTLIAAYQPRPARGLYPRVYKVGLVAAAQPSVEAVPSESEPTAREQKPAAIEPKQQSPKPAPRTAPQQAVRPSPRPGPALPPGMKILATEGGSDEGSYYLGIIMAKISRNWNNPYQGRQGELRTRIYFKVNRNGGIEAVDIEQPSGNAVFDQAGLRAVYLAKSFPPLPPEIPAQTLGVHFEFEYLK